MSRRRLTPEEIDLWKRVARTAERMHAERSKLPVSAPNPKPTPQKPVKPRFDPFDIGQSQTRIPPKDHDLVPDIREQVSRHPVRMDRKTFGKMKRGKMVPEGTIDLHGMTMDQAHGALIRYVLNAQRLGRRLVLVITGKGKHRDEPGPIPQRVGVLRHNVPRWLSLPPLNAVVLQVAEAHLKHGGGGAYYVYLRRGAHST